MTSTSENTTAAQSAAVAEGGVTIAPKPAKAARKTTSSKKAAKSAKGANKAVGKNAATRTVPKEFSKKQIVLDLLRRKIGATLDEIMQATGWQRHTCRGFLSVAGKANKITVEMTDAGRRYRIAK